MALKLILVGCCLVAVTARGQEIAADTRTLLDRLGGASWAERQQAEDDLVTRGPAVLTGVSTALAREHDPDVRDRLQSILLRIGREQQLAPTRLSVRRAFDNPAEAFEHLAAVVNLELDFATPEAESAARQARPVSLAFNDRPWMSALDQIAAVTGIDAQVEDGRLIVMGVTDRRPTVPAAYEGSIAVAVTGARHSQRLDLTNDMASTQQSITLAIRCEPKARLRGTGNIVEIKQCISGDGRSVLNPQLRRFPLLRQSLTTFTANISPIGDEEMPENLQLLEGQITGDLIVDMTEVKLDDLTTLPQTLDLGNVQVTIRSLEQAGRAATLVIDYPTNSVFSSRMTDLRIDEALRVIDDRGDVMRIGSVDRINDGQITQQIFRLTPRVHSAEARPARLTWTLVTKTRRVTVPFRFTDLPLPK